MLPKFVLLISSETFRRPRCYPVIHLQTSKSFTGSKNAKIGTRKQFCEDFELDQKMQKLTLRC